MINTKATIQARFYEKYMTVEQLREILSKLPADDRLYPNAVGKLLVVRAEKEVGYIDFVEEEYAIIPEN